jgi:hypothetical protein
LGCAVVFSRNGVKGRLSICQIGELVLKIGESFPGGFNLGLFR